MKNPDPQIILLQINFGKPSVSLAFKKITVKNYHITAKIPVRIHSVSTCMLFTGLDVRTGKYFPRSQTRPEAVCRGYISLYTPT